jgi:hypothetical protein
MTSEAAPLVPSTAFGPTGTQSTPRSPLHAWETAHVKRTGLFTTKIVSQCADRQIAIFFTGRQHAGENLGDVLRQRARELEPPIHRRQPRLAKR